MLRRLLPGRRRPAASNATRVPADRGYAICGAPRSGSNYFCELLSSTGSLGRPREYFNGAARRIHDDPDYPDDPTLQIQRILTMGATANGIYALKLFPGLFDTVSPHLRLTDVLPNLTFVRLRRRDVLGQAISWVRSIQSHQFRSTEVPQGAVHYDAEEITKYIGQVCQRNARWEMFFARTGLAPTEILYEDLASNAQEAVDRVSRVMKVAPRPEIAADRVLLRVQRDDISHDWRRRFIAERGDPNWIDPPHLLGPTL